MSGGNDPAQREREKEIESGREVPVSVVRRGEVHPTNKHLLNTH